MKQIESFKRIILLLLSTVSLAFQVALFANVWLGFYADRIWKPYYYWGHFLLIGLYAILLVAFSKMYGGLRIGYMKTGDVIFSQIFATICVNLIEYVQILLLSLKVVDFKPMLKVTILDIIGIILWSFISSTIYKKVFPPRDMLVIHGERPIEDILSKFATRQDKYKICKCMNISEGVDAICEEATKRYDAIVLWDIPTQMRNKLMKFCFGKSIRVYMMPKISDVLVKGAAQLHLFDTPILYIREYELSFEQRFAKRTIDIVCSFLLIIITSPFMLITAIGVKLYDFGPVLFKQTRCTRDLKEFHILKFRSMKVDAEKDGVARLAVKNDGRITPIGKFIRMVRLDELPQLFNILIGEMSFIGPRPERPEIMKQYEEDMPEFVYRTKVKAGLAGYAQVYGKYNTTPYDKLKLDLFYIQNYTVWMDVKLMLLTLKIIFRPESTEGIDDSQITALKSEEDK
ncbi:MAG TPA: exopolysaccharide biosynthesis polyprenyl glycosylphosphotransferase [Lachnospiraceae bacterium]|nr:exopolysaccharide biosynthesis polyprenyl glycosylphosphotransferase [Lachnospiraceae bacterium]